MSLILISQCHVFNLLESPDPLWIDFIQDGLHHNIYKYIMIEDVIHVSPTPTLNYLRTEYTMMLWIVPSWNVLCTNNTVWSNLTHSFGYQSYFSLFHSPWAHQSAGTGGTRQEIPGKRGGWARHEEEEEGTSQFINTNAETSLQQCLQQTGPRHLNSHGVAQSHEWAYRGLTKKSLR